MNNAFFSGLVDWGRSAISWIANMGQAICESVSGMSEATETALIGVLGTLLGTLLGWWLNSLSQKGKLSIYIYSWEDSFQYNKMGFMTNSSSIEQTQHYAYKLTLDLYNSSGATRIMRNITVVFSDGKKELYKSIPNDDSTRRSSGHACFYDEVSPINIPPKSIIQLSLHNGAWNNDGGLDFIWKTKKIYLTYTDEKNRCRKVKIKAEDYSKYFENHKSEETDNG